MMNKKLLYVTTAVIIIQPFFTWWIILPITAITGWFSKTMKSAIINGSGSVAFAWSLIFLYKYFFGGSILTRRVAEMLTLQNSFNLFFVTVLFASIAGMLGSICGYYFFQLRNKLQV